jgi:hypothetical protein
VAPQYAPAGFVTVMVITMLDMLMSSVQVRNLTSATSSGRTQCTRLNISGDPKVPVSIGLATLVLAVGTLSLCTRQLTRRRSSAPVVDLPDHQGDLVARFAADHP